MYRPCAFPCPHNAVQQISLNLKRKHVCDMIPASFAGKRLISMVVGDLRFSRLHQSGQTAKDMKPCEVTQRAWGRQGNLQDKWHWKLHIEIHSKIPLNSMWNFTRNYMWIPHEILCESPNATPCKTPCEITGAHVNVHKFQRISMWNYMWNFTWNSLWKCTWKYRCNCMSNDMWKCTQAILSSPDPLPFLPLI